MSNIDIRAAVKYHEVTKHSPISVRASRHILDWNNKPAMYKVYPKLRPFMLPRSYPRPEMDALDAIVADGVRNGGELDIAKLASILYLSAGITRRLRLPSGELREFRAASCAGALYPIEVYVVNGEIPSLDAGVYHFQPNEFALRKLRSGDFRLPLAEAAQDQTLGQAPASLVLSGIVWRSAWKYQARSYRYLYWDSGTILGNTLAVSKSMGFQPRIVLGFVDRTVNELIGVDGRREFTLAIVALDTNGQSAPTGSTVDENRHQALPLSSNERVYPEIQRMHESSMLSDIREVREWKSTAVEPSREPKIPGGRTTRSKSMDIRGLSIFDTIKRRGSTRRFDREEISGPHVFAILERPIRPVPFDINRELGSTLNQVFLIINAVSGLPSGSYHYSPSSGELMELRKGDFRSKAGYLCLEQELAADASVVFFFLADLPRVLRAFGNRGYRAAQLEAGILGGRIYLCAYALGLGATGLTFYDNEITQFFSPHAEGTSAMFVVAVGHPARRRGQDA